jgi:hypothetical protein
MSDTIKLRGGWQATIIRGDNGADIVINNPVGGDSDGKKFFEITSVGDPYGAPRVIQEPTLGIPARDGGIDIDGNLVGFIIVQDGKVVERASLSNLAYMKNSTVVLGDDGEVFINSESKGYVNLVFNPDKNRLIGLVAFVGPEKPHKVRVLEMEEAALLLMS